MGEDKTLDIKLYIDGKHIGTVKNIQFNTKVSLFVDKEKIDGINEVLNELAYAEENLENAQLAVDESMAKLFDVLPNDKSRDWLKKYENDISKIRDGIQKVVLDLEKKNWGAKMRIGCEIESCQPATDGAPYYKENRVYWVDLDYDPREAEGQEGKNENGL